MYKMYNTDLPTLKKGYLKYLSTLIRPRLNDENLFGYGGTVVQWRIQGRGPEGPPPPPPYFETKLRPEGPKKNCFETAPAPPPRLFI